MKKILLICCLFLTTSAMAQVAKNALVFKSKAEKSNLRHCSKRIHGADGLWYYTFSHITPQSEFVTMTVTSIDSLGSGEKIFEILLKEEDKYYHWYSKGGNTKTDTEKIHALITRG